MTTHSIVANYRGPVQAVILDWAGTAVDHGCCGPVAVFMAAFQKFGLTPTVVETREPMGMEKRAHVKTMLAMPRLMGLWQEKYDRLPTDKDIDAVFEQVLKLMPEVLADYARPVPGCRETMQALRNKNIKIGSCTGYSRSMMVNLVPAARKNGFEPDSLVTSDEVPEGRPMPWMCRLNCLRLGVGPAEAVVKVGDTLSDIGEGLNAGHWSVAVTRTSNALGLTEHDAHSLPDNELAKLEDDLKEKFLSAGAHYVISSIIDLPGLCELINLRLANGEKP